MSAQYLVNAQNVKSILSGNGATFAGLEYKTVIPTAAKFKHDVSIEKRTTANVMLFQSVKDFEIYKKAVIKTANMIEGQNVTEFEVSDNWFEHADKDCYSLIQHKTNGEQYLYFVANNAKSQYFVNGVAVQKDEIKQYLTPSKAKEVFDENGGVVYNKKNDVMHMMHPRTLKLANIITLTANKQTAIA
jgi:hypothetical protein